MGTVICHPCEDLRVLNLSLASLVFNLRTSGFNTSSTFYPKNVFGFGGSQKKHRHFRLHQQIAIYNRDG